MWVCLFLGAGTIAIVRQNREVNRGAAIAYAVSHHDVARLRYLIALGYDVNYRTYAAKDQAPLAWAVQRRDHEVVKILLEAGASPSPETAALLLLRRVHDQADPQIAALFARQGYQ